MLQINLQKTLHLPQKVIEIIKLNNKRYLNCHGDLVIHSQKYRTQEANQRDCIQKLHALIARASNTLVQKEPSQEQVQRVKAMITAYNNQRIWKKRLHSIKKNARCYFKSNQLTFK